MIVPSQQSQEEIDRALATCRLLFLHSLLSLLSGLLLFVLAVVRVLSAVVTIILACLGFILWGAGLWQKGIEILLSLIADHQQSLSTR